MAKSVNPVPREEVHRELVELVDAHAKALGAPNVGALTYFGEKTGLGDEGVSGQGEAVLLGRLGQAGPGRPRARASRGASSA